MEKAQPYIDELILEQALPSHYKDLVGNYLWPLVQDMMSTYQQRTVSGPWLLGLQGTQGSGKSTVCLFIKLLLEKRFDLNVVVLSLDDFYKTHAERLELSKTIHPLLATRGVPGTHDLTLAIDSIKNISDLTLGQACTVPSFNKAMDDRYNKSSWPIIKGPIDVILFEGWCVGVQAQPESSLTVAINELEKKEDADVSWRKYVNNNLEGQYRNFFQTLENLIVLKAPSFECVYDWRLLQEQKLKDTAQDGASTRIQSPEQIERFIAHYERLTRHALSTLSEHASWNISLNKQHDMISLTRNDHLLDSCNER